MTEKLEQIVNKEHDFVAYLVALASGVGCAFVMTSIGALPASSLDWDTCFFTSVFYGLLMSYPAKVLSETAFPDKEYSAFYYGISGTSGFLFGYALVHYFRD